MLSEVRVRVNPGARGGGRRGPGSERWRARARWLAVGALAVTETRSLNLGSLVPTAQGPQVKCEEGQKEAASPEWAVEGVPRGEGPRRTATET